MTWIVIVLVTLISMAISGRMAEARGRSVKTWLWVAAAVGPIGPLTLFLLGHRSGDVAHGR